MDRERHYSEDSELRELTRRAEEQYEDEYTDYEEDEDGYDTEEDYEEYEDGEPELEEYDEADLDEYADEDSESEEEYYDDDEDAEDEETVQPATASRVSSSPEDWRRFISSLSMDTICYALFTLLCLFGAAYWHTYYNTRIRRVTGREEVLKDLRYRRLYMSAELVRLERISSIEESIESLQLGLQYPVKPPYEVIDTTSINKQDQ